MKPMIDLTANTHLEEGEGMNLVRLSCATRPERVTVGAAPVAGSPDAWSRVEVLDLDGDWVRFWQLTVPLHDDEAGPVHHDRSRDGLDPARDECLRGRGGCRS